MQRDDGPKARPAAAPSNRRDEGAAVFGAVDSPKPPAERPSIILKTSQDVEQVLALVLEVGRSAFVEHLNQMSSAQMATGHTIDAAGTAIGMPKRSRLLGEVSQPGRVLRLSQLGYRKQTPPCWIGTANYARAISFQLLCNDSLPPVVLRRKRSNALLQDVGIEGC